MGIVERYNVVVIPVSSTLHDIIGPLSNRLFYGHDTKDIWVSTKYPRLRFEARATALLRYVHR